MTNPVSGSSPKKLFSENFTNSSDENVQHKKQKTENTKTQDIVQHSFSQVVPENPNSLNVNQGLDSGFGLLQKINAVEQIEVNRSINEIKVDTAHFDFQLSKFMEKMTSSLSFLRYWEQKIDDLGDSRDKLNEEEDDLLDKIIKIKDEIDNYKDLRRYKGKLLEELNKEEKKDAERNIKEQEKKLEEQNSTYNYKYKSNDLEDIRDLIDKMIDIEEEIDELSKSSENFAATEKKRVELLLKKNKYKKLRASKGKELTKNVHMLYKIEKKINNKEREVASIRQHLEKLSKSFFDKEVAGTLGENIKVNIDFRPMLEELFVANRRGKDEEEKLEQANAQISVVKNKILYTVQYLLRAQTFLESEIVRSELSLSKTFSLPQNQDIKVVIKEIFNGDRHNKGTQPLKIAFYAHEKKILEVVYKPRDGVVDKKIIDLFEKINELSREEKSVDTDLPSYSILSFGKIGSIHEFVSGKEPVEYSAYDEITNQIEEQGSKEAFNKSLARLESVCKAIGLTDLHRANVKFTEKEMIVPIDLEAIQLGEETLLYGNASTIPTQLSKSEQDYIKDFNLSIKHVNSRYVPISTSIFIDFDHHLIGPKKVVKSIQEALKKDFTVQLSSEELENLLTTDRSNGDIAYLTQKDGYLYYGSSGAVLAVAKYVKEDL